MKEKQHNKNKFKNLKKMFDLKYHVKKMMNYVGDKNYLNFHVKLMIQIVGN